MSYIYFLHVILLHLIPQNEQISINFNIQIQTNKRLQKQDYTILTGNLVKLTFNCGSEAIFRYKADNSAESSTGKLEFIKVDSDTNEDKGL